MPKELNRYTILKYDTLNGGAIRNGDGECNRWFCFPNSQNLNWLNVQVGLISLIDSVLRLLRNPFVERLGIGKVGLISRVDSFFALFQINEINYLGLSSLGSF
jgi:hypothetical protein